MDKVNSKTKILFCVAMTISVISWMFVCVTFRYEDTVSFTSYGVTFWDCLFSDNIGHYYTYASQNLRGALHTVSVFEYITFFPWIIWCFPIWLTHPLSTNPDVTGMKCIIWSKMFFVFCIVILCIYLYKLLIHLTGGDFEFSLAGVVLACASLEILDSTAYAGQDEIVYVTTLVIALHNYIMGKKKSGLVFLILTVTFCPLMLIPVVVILALLEKRIWRLAVDAALLLLPSVLFKFAYRNDPIFQAGRNTYNNLGIFQVMMNTGTIGTVAGPTPIAFVLLIILFFMAYMKKTSDENRTESLVYYTAIAFFSINFLSHTMWYRYCIYVPFFILLMGLTKENRNIKVFLIETLFITRFIASLSNGYNFWYSQMSSIGRRYLGEATETVIDIKGLGYDNALYVVRPVIIAVAIIFLVICHKRFNKELKFDIPWKVVVGMAPLAGIAICALVVLGAA